MTCVTLTLAEKLWLSDGAADWINFNLDSFFVSKESFCLSSRLIEIFYHMNYKHSKQPQVCELIPSLVFKLWIGSMNFFPFLVSMRHYNYAYHVFSLLLTRLSRTLRVQKLHWNLSSCFSQSKWVIKDS